MLAPGSEARLTGLQTEHLNGAKVRIVKYQAQKQRYVVDFPCGERSRAAFKQENLVPESEPESVPASGGGGGASSSAPGGVTSQTLLPGLPTLSDPVPLMRGAINLGMRQGLLTREASTLQYWKVVATFNIRVQSGGGGGGGGGPPPHFTVCYLRPEILGHYPAETCARGQPGLVPEALKRRLEDLVAAAKRSLPFSDRVERACLAAADGPIHSLRKAMDAALREHGGGFRWASTLDSDNLRAVHCTAGNEYARGVVHFSSIGFSASLAPLHVNLPLHWYLFRRADLGRKAYALANIVAAAEVPITSVEQARNLPRVGDASARVLQEALAQLRAAAARAPAPAAEGKGHAAQPHAAQPQPFSGAGRVLGGSGGAASGVASPSAPAPGSPAPGSPAAGSPAAGSPAAGSPAAESLKRRRQQAQLAALERRGLVPSPLVSPAEASAPSAPAGGTALVWLHGAFGPSKVWSGAQAAWRRGRLSHVDGWQAPIGPALRAAQDQPHWFDGSGDALEEHAVAGALRACAAAGARRVVVAGVSQGGAKALQVALQWHSLGLPAGLRLAGVVSVSGWLPASVRERDIAHGVVPAPTPAHCRLGTPKTRPRHARTSRTGAPVLLVHAAADEVVAVQRMRRARDELQARARHFLDTS